MSRERLFADDADFERELLRVARADAPPPGGADRLLASLAGASAASVAAAVAHARLAPPPAPWAKLAGLGTMKGFALLSLVAFAGGGGALAWRSAPNVRVTPVSSASDLNVEAREVPTVVAFARARLAAAAEPAAGARGAEAAPREATPAAPGTVCAPRESDLPRELALLDTARRLATEHNAAGAGAALTRYFDEFPAGALLPEARALEVDVAAEEGDHARVRTLGAAFLARHVSTPHAARVRQRVLEAAVTRDE